MIFVLSFLVDHLYPQLLNGEVVGMMFRFVIKMYIVHAICLIVFILRSLCSKLLIMYLKTLTIIRKHIELETLHSSSVWRFNRTRKRQFHRTRGVEVDFCTKEDDLTCLYLISKELQVHKGGCWAVCIYSVSCRWVFCQKVAQDIWLVSRRTVVLAILRSELIR